MPAPLRALLTMRKLVKQNLPRNSAARNPALGMGMQQRLSLSRRHPARLRLWCNRRKGISPRTSPFHPKASNPAYREAHRMQRQAQTGVPAAGREAAEEPAPAMAAEKVVWT